LPSPVFNAGAVASQVPGSDSPSFGLLKRGDVIVGVNDVITSAATSKTGIWASQKEISNVISSIRETPDGENVKLAIVHGKNAENTNTISITLRRNTDGVTFIGVMLGPNYLRTDVVKASSLGDAVTTAGSAVYSLTSETIHYGSYIWICTRQGRTCWHEHVRPYRGGEKRSRHCEQRGLCGGSGICCIHIN